MREIKFRAWDGERMKDVTSLGWIDGEMDYISTPKRSAPADNFVLMQYTGLKDRNGEEIYEGDIVEGQKDCYPRSVIGFNHGSFVLHKADLASWKVSYFQLEVIGNIWEHPHLHTPEDSK